MGAMGGSHYLQDDGWGYAVAKELIQFGSDLHHASRRLLSDDEVCHFLAVDLPIRFGDTQWTC